MYRFDRVLKSLGKREVGGSNVSGSDSVSVSVSDERGRRDDEALDGYSRGFKGCVWVLNASGE